MATRAREDSDVVCALHSGFWTLEIQPILCAHASGCTCTHGMTVEMPYPRMLTGHEGPRTVAVVGQLGTQTGGYSSRPTSMLQPVRGTHIHRQVMAEWLKTRCRATGTVRGQTRPNGT
jgi:hypothetical protein